MRQFLLSFFVFCLSWMSKAQQIIPVDEHAYTDSLSVVLRSKVSDSVKANIHYLLADFYRVKDTISSRKHLVSARGLATKYPYLKAAYSFYEGQFYYNWNKPKAAKSFQAAIENLKPYPTEASYLLQAASWYNYAIMVKDKEGYPFVLDILTNHAIPLAKKSGNREKTAHYYSQFGTLLMYNGQFAEATKYNQMAIDLLKNDFPNSTTLVLAYIGAATNLIYADKKDLAKRDLDAVAAILKPYPQSVNYPFYYLAQSLYHIATSQFEQALVFAEKGMVQARNNHQRELLPLLVFRKYEIFLHQQKYVEAKRVLTEIIEEGVITKDVNNKKTVYNELVKVNELLGDKEAAFLWLKKYSVLHDSLSAARLKETVTELEAQYQNVQNQQEIAVLEKDKTASVLKANKNKQFIVILSAVSLLLLLLAVFIFIYYRNYKKLAKQKEINHLQEIRERIQQEQLKVTQAMLDGEEKERGRIARELHDGLGGMLTAVKMNFSGWASLHLRPEQRHNFNQIGNQLDVSISELRNLARNLMPETLLRFGLEIALRDLCDLYRTTQLEIDCQLYEIQNNIDLPIQLQIYRIVQELISNAVKHSEGDAVLVQCSQRDQLFFITVEDNGKGFVLDAVVSDGMGLQNISNRVQYLGGKIEISSLLQQGTTVNIELKTRADD